MDINLNNYELLPVESTSTVESAKEETLYDITVDGDHTFFVRLAGSDVDVLAHNCDGDHITAMLIGWFRKFAPNLFDEGRVCKLVTPLIILKDQKDKMIQHFFSVADFKAWEAKNPNHRYKVVYLKGLGSWERQDLTDLIDKNGLQGFIQEFKLDEEGKVYIDDWLGPDAEKRKKYLREYSFDINQA